MSDKLTNKGNMKQKGGAHMGNLIKDFWTRTYKGKQYFGICEVVKGDVQQKRHEKKYETHIEKALKYTMKYDVLSHMSIQKYTSFLGERSYREENEETYYPFFFEVEPKLKPGDLGFQQEYKRAAGEAIRIVYYAIYELGMHKEDILIMINNSRSIYIMFNPKSYGLKPSAELHMIYREMYKMIDDEIGLEYVDTSIYNSYGLMKTPNCYYAGGYFRKITIEQLKKLYENPDLKTVYTSTKKSLDYYVPGEKANGMTWLYETACMAVKNKKSSNKTAQHIYINNCEIKCIQYIESNIIEKGYRNHSLVSMGIYLKNKGYTKEQTLEILSKLALDWKHDEGYGQIKSKVNTIYRYDYKFSCKKARQDAGICKDSICSKCIFGGKVKENKIEVKADIIDDLWENKASKRHYIVYLKLSRKNLFNKWFIPEEEGLSDRTIRELCKLTKNLNRVKNKGRIYISNTASGNTYLLPTDFVDNEVYLMLDEHIKHYLKLLIKGYVKTKKASNRYINLNVSKKKIMKDLNYKDISGVYKLIKKLKDIGLLVYKKGKVVTLYYESYKVTDIEQYREAKNNAIYIQDKENTVVNGESYVITRRNFKRIISKRTTRGSPG